MLRINRLSSVLFSLLLLTPIDPHPQETHYIVNTFISGYKLDSSSIHKDNNDNPVCAINVLYYRDSTPASTILDTTRLREVK
jgi:hypothetical protein